MGWCRYCKRIGSVHCMNTRDMDPDDGLNHDPACHAALVELGGGERGRTADDFKPAYMSRRPSQEK